MIAYHLELGQLWRCPVTWCAVWKGSARACLEHLAEKHGGSTLDITTKVAKFFPPWSVTREVWHTALRPDVSGVAVDALLFHEAGCRLVHRYRVNKDPFPHPALRDGVIPRLLSCVCRAMAIARLTYLRISIPSSGALPGQVPMECFPEETAPVAQSRRRRVSFAEEVTRLIPPLILPVVVEEVALASETGVLPLILPVVEELVDDTPAAELFGEKPPAPESGVPPPPGFLPFLFPENDGGMGADDICVRFGGITSLTLSPISRESSDTPHASDVPPVGPLCPPPQDNLSEVIPAVGYACLPLPSVDNSVMPELVWVPALPQPKGRASGREVPVPRWRLAREGPFLEERSTESIRSLGPDCAFRNTTYSVSDYAEPTGDYRLLPNHPRFVEWIGVPQSAGLLELSGRQWVDKLSRDQAVTAAVHLQRDMGLMQTNVDVLDQYALSLQKAASRIIDHCLGPYEFPAAEIATGALGPRVRRAAIQMEDMGLWRPSLDPLRLH